MQAPGWCSSSHLISVTASPEHLCKRQIRSSHVHVQKRVHTFTSYILTPAIFLILCPLTLHFVWYTLYCIQVTPDLYTLSKYACTLPPLGVDHAESSLSVLAPHPHSCLSLVRINPSLPGAVTPITLRLVSWWFVWGNVPSLLDWELLQHEPHIPSA